MVEKKVQVDTKTKVKKKSFSAKLTDEQKFHGRYMGGSPFQAASKALTEIIRRANVKSGKQIVFCLKEITQKSANKRHFYLGERVKLSEPVVYTVDGNEIRKEFKNQIRKLRNAELSQYITDLELAGGAKKKKTVAKKAAKKAVPKKAVAKKAAPKKAAPKKAAPKKAAKKDAPKKAAPKKAAKKTVAAKVTKKTAKKSAKKKSKSTTA
jgi:hypothetical protein